MLDKFFGPTTLSTYRYFVIFMDGPMKDLRNKNIFACLANCWMADLVLHKYRNLQIIIGKPGSPDSERKNEMSNLLNYTYLLTLAPVPCLPHDK